MSSALLNKRHPKFASVLMFALVPSIAIILLLAVALITLARHEPGAVIFTEWVALTSILAGSTLIWFVRGRLISLDREYRGAKEAADESEELFKKLTEATFDGVVTSEQPVVIDFWAPWCGPCRAIAPVLDELARELGDEVTIGKVNVDEQPALAARFGVQAIPQLAFFKDGVLKDKVVGAVPKAEIVKRLDALRG